MLLQRCREVRAHARVQLPRVGLGGAGEGKMTPGGQGPAESGSRGTMPSLGYVFK